MKVKDKAPYLILLFFVLIALLIRSKLLFFNLPVSGNVDERQGLRLLFLFQNNTLNPLFFRYPTLYYYATYFFIKIFGDISNTLFLGRLLNLIISVSIAFVIYHLSNNIFKYSFSPLIKYKRFLPLVEMTKNLDVLSSRLKFEQLLFCNLSFIKQYF